MAKYTGYISFILEAIIKQETAINWNLETEGSLVVIYLSKYETAWNIVSSCRSNKHLAENIHSTYLHLAINKGSSGPVNG